ncbi:TPR-like protein [Karstenula rhodostoma CBS 690.94]|uniref:TPR-like protein n=1 Tax=Karstenula rhodostoma CBS 690.94 TaxID=1392251 RepID=A0A9P4P4Y3_9PLEO|nr:TPR-like protein [Karstenula rhodostoma CBS 690.94]
MTEASYHNGSIKASVVQLGTGNAARDIFNGPVTVVHDRPPNPAPWHTVPFRRDEDFVPRDRLDDIRRTCARPAGCAALVGLGGVGKSQIAIEYAYQVRDESPSTWVFWVHAGTRARFEEGYRRIAEATKMDGWEDPKADVLRLVRRWLCDESNGRWLIVVDNADDASIFFQDLPQDRTTDGPDNTPAEPLFDFLPQSSNGSILVTSRSWDAAYRLTGNHDNIFEVQPMNKDDAVALLRRKLGSIVSENEAVQLIDALDSMPLALTQAAAFIKQRAPRMTLSKYIDEVHRSDVHRVRLLEKNVGDLRRDARAINSIIVTWQISFEHIQERTPTAAQLLSLMSLFDRQGIPESLLQKRYKVNDDHNADFEDDIQTLINFSLVKVEASERDFEMHRLVQFSTKKWLELNNELEQWKKTYAMLMDESYPEAHHENWPTCQALFPHAEAVLNSPPKEADTQVVWASVLSRAAWYAREMGQYNKAYEMDLAAFQTWEMILGAEHEDTLASLNSLGMDVNRQGRYDEAEAMHQQALQMRKRVLGVDHPSTLASMSNLASTYSDQGRWADAQVLEVQLLEIHQRKLGVDHPDMLTSMANLASTYRMQGQWDEAEALEVYVLKTSTERLGVDHPDTLASMGNLALTYMDQGRWREAEALEVSVTESRKKKFGWDHPETLRSMANLASMYREQGQAREAEAVEVQVMDIRKTKFGADHPDTLSSMSNLASTYVELNRWREAEALDMQVLETRKKRFGADHPDTLTSMNNLSVTYQHQGRWTDAERLDIQVVETRKRKLGVDHPDTLASLANLATAYANQGRWTDAEAIEVQLLETTKRKLGEDHPDTLFSMHNLAFTWKGQGFTSKAISLMQDCCTRREAVLGPQHPYTISSREALAAWESEVPEPEQAERRLDNE